MTPPSQDKVHFDVKQSVRGRDVARLIILPLWCAGLIALGLWLIPDSMRLRLDVTSIETWSVWGFLGVVFVGSGIWGLLKEVVFFFRARSSFGEWHFRLTDVDLLWDVPKHAHGKEEGFSVCLDEIERLEYKTIQKHEELNQSEYWVHFRFREPIQLRSYSGVSLPWAVEKISAAGVEYEETVE